MYFCRYVYLHTYIYVNLNIFMKEYEIFMYRPLTTLRLKLISDKINSKDEDLQTRIVSKETCILLILCMIKTR